MGFISALAMSEQEQAGNVEFDRMINWHLHYNHYPPVPAGMAAVCKAAILAYEDEDYDPDLLDDDDEI